jgi:hypothetical protein
MSPGKLARFSTLEVEEVPGSIHIILELARIGGMQALGFFFEDIDDFKAKLGHHGREGDSSGGAESFRGCRGLAPL